REERCKATRSTAWVPGMLPPRAPRSTPVPYTTLFRSQRPRGGNHRATRLHVLGQDPPEQLRVQDRTRHRLAAAVRGPVGHGARKDRKSTRLNSSHRTSSYAVFRLKKKKQRHASAARSG